MLDWIDSSLHTSPAGRMDNEKKMSMGDEQVLSAASRRQCYIGATVQPTLLYP